MNDLINEKVREFQYPKMYFPSVARSPMKKIYQDRFFAATDLHNIDGKSYNAIYLAGPIINDYDWQSEMISKIRSQFGKKEKSEVINENSIFIYNPRPIKEIDDYVNKINWDHLCMNQSDAIIFYIPKNESNKAYAQTTLLEIGIYLNRFLNIKPSLVFCIQDPHIKKIVKATIESILEPNPSWITWVEDMDECVSLLI